MGKYGARRVPALSTGKCRFSKKPVQLNYMKTLSAFYAEILRNFYCHSGVLGSFSVRGTIDFFFLKNRNIQEKLFRAQNTKNYLHGWIHLEKIETDAADSLEFQAT